MPVAGLRRVEPPTASRGPHANNWICSPSAIRIRYAGVYMLMYATGYQNVTDTQGTALHQISNSLKSLQWSAMHKENKVTMP